MPSRILWLARALVLAVALWGGLTPLNSSAKTGLDYFFDAPVGGKPGGSSGITNPLEGGCETIDACLKNVVSYALGIAGILALAGIVYGGFLYITAAGSQDRIEAGKNAVTYSVIGLIVIGLAFAIVTFIFNALQGGGGGGGGDVFGPGGGGGDLFGPSR